MYPNSSIWLFPLIFLWFTICAWLDWRTREVSNWLTLPAIPIALAMRLLGWTNGSWWLAAIVAVGVIVLWLIGGMGGADSKGWLTFALLGDEVILAAAMGILVWYGAIWLYHRSRGFSAKERIPGFPGYWLGMVLLSIFQFLIRCSMPTVEDYSPDDEHICA